MTFIFKSSASATEACADRPGMAPDPLITTDLQPRPLHFQAMSCWSPYNSVRRLETYSVEKLCFEDATIASGPLERSQLSAHGGVLATSRALGRSGPRDSSSAAGFLGVAG